MDLESEFKDLARPSFIGSGELTFLACCFSEQNVVWRLIQSRVSQSFDVMSLSVRLQLDKLFLFFTSLALHCLLVKKIVGWNKSQINVVCGEIQVSFYVGSAMVAKYTHLREKQEQN